MHCQMKFWLYSDINLELRIFERTTMAARDLVDLHWNYLHTRSFDAVHLLLLLGTEIMHIYGYRNYKLLGIIE